MACGSILRLASPDAGTTRFLSVVDYLPRIVLGLGPASQGLKNGKCFLGLPHRSVDSGIESVPGRNISSDRDASEILCVATYALASIIKPDSRWERLWKKGSGRTAW